MGRTTQPVLAGLVTALVGFASSFAIVLAGLRAVGADPRQAASGLLALCVAAGVTAIWLGLWRRMPISIAWSTPGAALLVSTGTVEGGFAAAVGAFVVCGLLIAITGLFAPLGRWIAAIPQPLAAAMLAGVLLELCVAPARALAEVPLMAVPVVLTWALLSRFAKAWAMPAALVVAVVAIALDGADGLDGAALAPVVEPTVPQWSLPAMVSIAFPLYLVTMASQNVPGMAVLAGYGYRPALPGILVGTGLGSAAAAPLGGHAVNLAAITAALAAGPDAHPDPGRRWIASVTAGATMIALGLGAGLATALVLASPPVLIEGVAGLALLGALGSAVTTAIADPTRREAAVVTFAVTASGVTIAGIGAAFWGLLAGAFMLLLHRRRPAGDESADREPAEVAVGAR
ncbi:benzoate membrane transport protein [Thermomonospora echinospora]|uniref:Benzoate membrane transport protein n=1 Tax=Thermomonospora echinospora TaxID=1992 RepID=A0A1H6D6J9_9ACTN|nr:benzoate/H(+) symporter BenE family transporter [Thermomonospora echinospora]SEG80901.1 benzoate membrane transport protein [Thermomonospora echinospora]